MKKTLLNLLGAGIITFALSGDVNAKPLEKNDVYTTQIKKPRTITEDAAYSIVTIGSLLFFSTIANGARRYQQNNR